jgi:hypothetical protein
MIYANIAHRGFFRDNKAEVADPAVLEEPAAA